MSGLNDLMSALRMRELLTSIATEVVERLRPEEKIGKVYSYDKSSQTARILLAGETVDNLIVARFALDKQPTIQMEPLWNSLGYSAPGDIVRISGKPGSYYILDFVSGYPSHWDGTEVGFGFMWFSNTLPNDQYLWCRGGTFLGSQYPVLASVVGDSFGTHSGDTYYLPNLNARSPIGVGGPAAYGSVGNNYSLGQGWGHEAMQQHNHVQVIGYSEGIYGANWTFANGGTGPRDFNVGPNYPGTDNAGTGNMGNIHPVLAVNFIVRAK